MQNKTTLNRILRGFKNTLMILGLSIWCMSLNAQTISTASGTNYNHDYSINNPASLVQTFVIDNTNASSRVLTSMTLQMAPYFGNSGPSTIRLYYSATSLSGAPTVTTPVWTLIATGNVTVPATLSEIPVLSGMSFVIPANTQYRFAIEATKGLTFSVIPTPTPNIFTSGGVSLKVGNFQIAGLNIGYAGLMPSPAVGNTPTFFGGSVTLNPEVVCSGTPTPGNTVSSAATVCPATNFTLSTSTAPAPGTTGITYIWQSGPSATGPWTNIPGATNSTLTTTQATPTYYQALVSCGANTAASVPVQVTMSAVTSCYCAAGATSTSFEKITNVTLNTINNNSTATAGYENFTALSTSLEPGRAYPLSVRVAPSYAADQVIVWIDYNQNGVFTDPGETVYTSPAGFPTVTPAIVSSTIIVPFTALPGVTRMRVRLHDTSLGANATSCGNSTYGQVEDYSVNILPVVACSGTPAPGNTVSSVPTVCAGTNFTLTLQNFTSGSGVTYQWQSSATGVAGSFTNITGATAVFLTTTQGASTYYQAVVTCGANSTTSTPIQVLLTPYTGCYCAVPTSNCTFDDRIANVTFGSTLNNSSACSANGYANYISTVPATDIVIGVANPMRVTVGPGGTEYVGVWIDYNHNGAFETAEFTLLGSGNGVTITNNINIPATALLGQTGMRVRVRYNATQTGAQACTAIAFGETEDYLVNIVPCIPVTVTTQPTAATITCGGNATFNVVTSGSLPVYQWQTRTTPTGIWQNVTNTGIYTGATTASLTLTNVPTTFSGNQYRVLITGACSASDPSNAVALTVNPLITTVTPTSANICLGSIQQLSITNTLSNAIAWTEGFDVVSPLPTGWAAKQNSLPLGPTGWFQGQSTTFPSFTGAPNSYIAANYENTDPAGSGTISNWLMTPVQNLKNGDFITFYSRIPAGTEYADRLEVRLSAAGNSTNVGTTATSVGDFTTVLLTINPTLVTGVYPKAWTQFTATVSGLAAPTTGRIAFRYFVTDAGGNAPNGNFIGIDNVQYTITGATATGVWNGRANTIFTDAAATTLYTGTLASTVYVKPDTIGIVNYSVSFATPTCQSTLVTIPVTVRALPTSISVVTNKTICAVGNTSFTATATGGSGFTYQWQVSTDGGTTFTNVTNGGVYSGATTTTLLLTAAPASYNNYRYRMAVSALPCVGSLNSNAATLTVNPTPVIVLSANPLTEIYPGQTTTLTAAVSPNAGQTYTWYRNGVIVPGATANTLVVDVDALGTYTVTVIDVNGCSSSSSSVTIKDAANDILFIYPNPNRGQFQVRYFSELGTTQFPRTVNVYDNKGTRVFTKAYTINTPYTRIDVDLKNQAKGIYTVELTDYNGNRIKTGRVLVL